MIGNGTAWKTEDEKRFLDYIGYHQVEGFLKSSPRSRLAALEGYEASIDRRQWPETIDVAEIREHVTTLKARLRDEIAAQERAMAGSIPA